MLSSSIEYDKSKWQEQVIGKAIRDSQQCPLRYGTISPSDIVRRQKQGIVPGEFEKVLGPIRAGTTYASVHSDKFPQSEIRGQIRLRRFGLGSLDDLLENN
jgi:CHRD domain